MKKMLLLAIAAMVVSTGAMAQEKGKAKKTEKTEVACAVMTTHKVNIKKATADHMFADYKGKRYFFCCAGCPGQFKASPAKFASHESIPTPKATKKKG